MLDVFELARENGEPPEAIAEPLGITSADVFEALAYCYPHPEEMHEARQTKAEMQEALAEQTKKPPED